MSNKFNPINFQYGFCLNPSDPQHRNAYPDITNYADGTNSCINTNNIAMAPGLYPNPSIQEVNKINLKVINNLDSYFLNL